jgi:hypothetical protein
MTQLTQEFSKLNEESTLINAETLNNSDSNHNFSQKLIDLNCSYDESSSWKSVIDVEVTNENLKQATFLLSIFDNIVGPKLVHHWALDKSQFLNDELLKYISIHTLNGELYQDKLLNQQKFRLYLIQEIGYAIFSTFFDASTFSSSSYSSGGVNSWLNENTSAQLSNNGELNQTVLDNETSIKAASNTSLSEPTMLNCLSLILPLEKKEFLLSRYGENTQFFINVFENIIIEFKVFAQIRNKVPFCANL